MTVSRAGRCWCSARPAHSARAWPRRSARPGAEVTGVDRAEPPAARRLDGVRYAAADVLDDASLGALFDAAAPLWAVVNTVGGFAGHRPLAELDPAELTGQLSLNLVSAALITKHALRVMQPVGAGPDRAYRQPGRRGQQGLGVRLLGQQARRPAPGHHGRRGDRGAPASR